MNKELFTILTSVTLLVGIPVAAGASQASENAHQKRISRHHQTAVHPSGDITSFSSSSVLHVGVNRPPKNR